MSDTSYIVFFDGGCPLCSREIAHYRGLQAIGAIDWLDVSVAGVDLASYGITQEQAMRRFHVMDAEGNMHTGADGFVALWSQLPGYRWVSRLARGMGLVGLMDWFYSKFASWHFKRRCESGACGIGSAPGP